MDQPYQQNNQFIRGFSEDHEERNLQKTTLQGIRSNKGESNNHNLKNVMNSFDSVVPPPANQRKDSIKQSSDVNTLYDSREIRDQGINKSIKNVVVKPFTSQAQVIKQDDNRAIRTGRSLSGTLPERPARAQLSNRSLSPKSNSRLIDVESGRVSVTNVNRAHCDSESSEINIITPLQSPYHNPQMEQNYPLLRSKNSARHHSISVRAEVGSSNEVNEDQETSHFIYYNNVSINSNNSNGVISQNRIKNEGSGKSGVLSPTMLKNSKMSLMNTLAETKGSEMSKRQVTKRKQVRTKSRENKIISSDDDRSEKTAVSSYNTTENDQLSRSGINDGTRVLANGKLPKPVLAKVYHMVDNQLEAPPQIESVSNHKFHHKFKKSNDHLFYTDLKSPGFTKAIKLKIREFASINKNFMQKYDVNYKDLWPMKDAKGIQLKGQMKRSREIAHYCVLCWSRFSVINIFFKGLDGRAIKYHLDNHDDSIDGDNLVEVNYSTCRDSANTANTATKITRMVGEKRSKSKSQDIGMAPSLQAKTIAKTTVANLTAKAAKPNLANQNISNTLHLLQTSGINSNGSTSVSSLINGLNHLNGEKPVVHISQNMIKPNHIAANATASAFIRNTNFNFDKKSQNLNSIPVPQQNPGNSAPNKNTIYIPNKKFKLISSDNDDDSDELGWTNEVLPAVSSAAAAVAKSRAAASKSANYLSSKEREALVPAKIQVSSFQAQSLALQAVKSNVAINKLPVNNNSAIMSSAPDRSLLYRDIDYANKTISKRVEDLEKKKSTRDWVNSTDHSKTNINSDISQNQVKNLAFGHPHLQTNLPINREIKDANVSGWLRDQQQSMSGNSSRTRSRVGHEVTGIRPIINPYPPPEKHRLLEREREERLKRERNLARTAVMEHTMIQDRNDQRERDLQKARELINSKNSSSSNNNDLMFNQILTNQHHIIDNQRKICSQFETLNDRVGRLESFALLRMKKSKKMLIKRDKIFMNKVSSFSLSKRRKGKKIFKY